MSHLNKITTINSAHVPYAEIEHIFLTEFYKHIGERTPFFIPPDIEQRLPKHRALQTIINLIHKHRRGYGQGGYIS
ncbi:MAG: hypothetical protein IJU72_04685 [Bacteroidales bacterium]|nr:hypothetical protein [Bacteroidales bacterium]